MYLKKKIMKYGYGMELDGTWVWNGNEMEAWNGMKYEYGMEWNMNEVKYGVKNGPAACNFMNI